MSVIQVHTAVYFHQTGVHPSNYSARSLGAGGAMALLAGKCDNNIIKLMGCWNSDVMMKYLHQQLLPIYRRSSSLMFNHGQHSFLPTETVPLLD